MSLLDNVVAFVKVIASEVSGENAAVLFNVVGIGGFKTDAKGNVTGDDASDDGGEQATSQPNYQSLGIVGRPLPPDDDGFLEAAAVRVDDGLETIAYRDLRINRALNPTGAGTAPSPGQIFFAGYGGAFVSHQQAAAPSGDRTPSITTIYVPYQFADGVPTKAHAIVVDPTRGIQLVHGDGPVFTLTHDVGNGEPGIAWALSATSWARISASEVLIQAPKITLKGNVYLGAQAENGVPLFGGPISPPCPSLFVSPA